MVFTRIVCLVLLSIVALGAPGYAQVTTATLYGLIRDTSGAVVPGASVTATNDATGVTREGVSDAAGEFAMPALPSGTYTVKIDLSGFKTRVSTGIALGAGQTLRQAFELEVGAMAETVTVAGEAPLVDTATSKQASVIGSTEVTELPLQRRNLISVLSMAPGVTGEGSNLLMNGVSSGGTAYSIDGTDANSNPEDRSLSQFGGNSQVSGLSIDAVQEVQVEKGVLPAEYGGVTGGQINIISKSGTNVFHGSMFENYQGDRFASRDVFLLSGLPKPAIKFNQWGGTLGGPVLRNKMFFFFTYEGYREESGSSLSVTVPSEAYRSQILSAYPQVEMKMILDSIRLPNEFINADIGRWNGSGIRTRRDNFLSGKVDVSLFNGANLNASFTHSRPYATSPDASTDGSAGNVFPNKSDRLAVGLALTRGFWVSESRVGYNYADVERVAGRWFWINPNKPETTPYGQRIPYVLVSGTAGFNTTNPELYDLEGRNLMLEQKVSRVIGSHLVKLGGRWYRQGGCRANPEAPAFQYANKADFLANIPEQVRPAFGSPPCDGSMAEWGLFIQNDWRVSARTVINAGLRYDSYNTSQVWGTVEGSPAEVVNRLAPPDFPNNWAFGPSWPYDEIYNPDRNNFGPRLGFAHTLNAEGTMVVRGGVGVLYSTVIPELLRQGVADPKIPTRAIWIKTEAANLGLKFPMYNDDLTPIIRAQGNGEDVLFAAFTEDFKNPYTIQSMASFQRSFGKVMSAEVGYLNTTGRDFPLARLMAIAFDRQTGARPAGWNIGTPAGGYIDSQGDLSYHALQMSVRQRMAKRVQWEMSYTYAQSKSLQNANLDRAYGTFQDFNDFKSERGASNGDVRHQGVINAIFEVPGETLGSPVLRGILGGWQLASIARWRTGSAMRVIQTSGITDSRPDIVPGAEQVLGDWQDTLLYLDRAAYALVPTFPATGATTRPGTVLVDGVRGLSRYTVDLSLSKSFTIGQTARVQIRLDAFNALNTVNFNNPNTTVNSATFGRITGAAAARTGQAGVKFTF